MKQIKQKVLVEITVSPKIQHKYPNFSTNYNSIEDFIQSKIDNMNEDEFKDFGYSVTVKKRNYKRT